MWGGWFFFFFTITAFNHILTSLQSSLMTFWIEQRSFLSLSTNEVSPFQNASLFFHLKHVSHPIISSNVGRRTWGRSEALSILGSSSSSSTLEGGRGASCSRPVPVLAFFPCYFPKVDYSGAEGKRTAKKTSSK